MRAIVPPPVMSGKPRDPLPDTTSHLATVHGKVDPTPENAAVAEASIVDRAENWPTPQPSTAPD